jgi:hypothetical protein
MATESDNEINKKNFYFLQKPKTKKPLTKKKFFTDIQMGKNDRLFFQ